MKPKNPDTEVCAVDEDITVLVLVMERSRSPDEDLPWRQRGRGRKIGAAPESGGGVTRFLPWTVLIEQLTHFLDGCSNECWGIGCPTDQSAFTFTLSFSSLGLSLVNSYGLL